VIRINLIPPEIVEKRKDEKRWRWVLLAGVAAAALVFVFYGVMWYQVTVRQSEVAALKQEAESLQAETVRFRIFQQNEAALTTRKRVVAAASAGRVDWARMFNEISMVLPTDMFLLTLQGTEPVSGNAQVGLVNMTGQAIDYPDDTPDNGFKSVAKAVVRLSELAQLDNVWLTLVERPSAPVGTGTAATTQPLINWSLKARISVGPATAAPAPATVPQTSP
jgi:hypothetical protein